jgi:hypothetical protein
MAIQFIDNPEDLIEILEIKSEYSDSEDSESD